MKAPFYQDGFIFWETEFGNRYKTDVGLTKTEHIGVLPEIKKVSYKGFPLKYHSGLIYTDKDTIFRFSHYELRFLTTVDLIDPEFGEYKDYTILTGTHHTWFIDPKLKFSQRRDFKLTPTPDQMLFFDGMSFRNFNTKEIDEERNLARIKRIHDC